MKILKILGIAAGIHALALFLIFTNPGCSYTKAASADTPPISSAPTGDANSTQSAVVTTPDSVGIRFSPTRPGTPVASALETEPVSDVTPVTTYTVARGDSLWSIAKKNQLTKAELAAANKLKSTSVLHVGQKLVIPSKAGQPARASAPAAAPAVAAAPITAPSPATSPDKGPADAVRHVVKAGETLGGIARRYGVSRGDIAVANNITDPKKIHPGQELIIPSKSSKSKAAKGKSDTPDASKAASAAPPDQDLDTGLKPPAQDQVPVVKIEDSSTGSQPKNP